MSGECLYSWCPRRPDDRRGGSLLCALHRHADGAERRRLGVDV